MNSDFFFIALRITLSCFEDSALLFKYSKTSYASDDKIILTCFIYNSTPLLISSFRLEFVLCIQVIPLSVAAILLLSSKYFKITIKVL